MNAISVIENTKNSIDKLQLTDSYRSKVYTKNFNSHLDCLIQTSIDLTGNENTVLKKNNIEITNSLYWQTEAYILENLDDVEDDSILTELDDLEDILYNKIIKSLGKNYDKSSMQNRMIDLSVHNVIMYVKYHYFSKNKEFNNPWDYAKNILFDNSVIHTFSDNIEEFYDYGLKLNDKESEITKYNRIGILGKGNRKDYTTGYVRDLVSIRNTLFNILEEEGFNSSKPIKINKIFEKVRSLGIYENELSDSNIKNWLITPLKRNNKVGSCREGYFIINSCLDLEVSYISHLENLKGYYRTLENHRRMSEKFKCSDFNFQSHNEFLKDK
jgi:hypothetical protein